MRSGIERVIVDTYQAVSGTGHKAIVELEEQIRRTPRARPKVASVYPHPIGFNALPHIDVFLDNGYTKEEWKVVTESRKILHLPDLRVSCTAVRVPGVRQPLRGRPRRDPRRRSRPARPGRCSPRVRAWWSRTTRRPTSTRWPTEAAGSDDVYVGRVRQDPSIPGDRGLAFWVRQRQPPQGRGLERGGARRGCWSRAAGSAGRATAPARAPGDGPRDRRRAPRGARGDRGRGPGLHRCRLTEGRTRAVPGEGDPDTEVVFVGRGPRVQRGPRGPAVRGPRRRPAGATCSAASAGGATRCSSPTSSSAARPSNRDPQPDEIAACAPYLRRQLEALDPAVVVTLGRLLDGHGSCRVPGSARPTARANRWTRRPGPATRWSSRCTTRPRRSAHPASSARASRTSPACRTSWCARATDAPHRRVEAAAPWRTRRPRRPRRTTGRGGGGGRADHGDGRGCGIHEARRRPGPRHPIDAPAPPAWPRPPTFRRMPTSTRRSRRRPLPDRSGSDAGADPDAGDASQLTLF